MKRKQEINITFALRLRTRHQRKTTLHEREKYIHPRTSGISF